MLRIGPAAADLVDDGRAAMAGNLALHLQQARDAVRSRGVPDEGDHEAAQVLQRKRSEAPALQRRRQECEIVPEPFEGPLGDLRAQRGLRDRRERKEGPPPAGLVGRRGYLPLKLRSRSRALLSQRARRD